MPILNTWKSMENSKKWVTSSVTPYITLSIPKAYPFGDAKWILELGREGLGKDDKRCEPVFLSNSLECLIEAAQQGKEIIGTYDKMSILKDSNLQNILPDLIIKKQKIY